MTERMEAGKGLCFLSKIIMEFDRKSPFDILMEWQWAKKLHTLFLVL